MVRSTDQWGEWPYNAFHLDAISMLHFDGIYFKIMLQLQLEYKLYAIVTIITIYWQEGKVILPHLIKIFYQIKTAIVDLPYCRWFRTLYFQIIIFFFHLEICKYEWDCIPRLCHNCPCAIRIILIFIRKAGARDDTTGSSHSSSTCILSC